MNNETQPYHDLMAQTDRRIPVTLLTGFLGAGKTTLLNNLLQHPEMAGAAVLINEFGEVGIDHHLVDRVDETMMILDSGCICCSVQGDLVKALRNLAQRSSMREIPQVSRVVIETTGLADPLPVISTLTQEWFVAARYQCDGVITVVDATHALQQLDQHREAVRQVAMADRLLITKCDLANTTGRAALDGRLDALNPGAPRIDVCRGRISPDALFGCGIYSTGGRSTNVAAWLGAEQMRAQKPPGAGTAADHAADHSHGHHGDSVSSFVISFPDPVAWYSFAVAMGRILQTHGPKILRVKGLMNIMGDPLPRVIHCVQDVAYPPVSLCTWPAQSPFADHHGRLVFIVRDLNREEVEAIRCGFSAVQNSAPGGRPTIAGCPFPTRCWLAHNVSRVGSSAFKLDGWEVQGIRLRSNRAVPIT
ncbi:CobW family GTP-binding protein [Geotalea uraniireducens]|uniref:Cobalamin synthesis protein, P47K n=1 Tax=Geotalea uraniireducens (strain Rf4) TaxID=351605 RepID=A5G9N2_GEOUR|nr:GTP-binding protein [Geotalea uraniireducens]ABQ28500.1 cobalamin synthesis protein, P47K [Geotalea uraniireducens Rf4]